MDSRKKIAAVCLTVIIVSVIWFSTTVGETASKYEIEPQITLPEHKTGLKYSVDAYERLMNRFMDLVGKDLSGMHRDVDRVLNRLESIDRKLADVDERISRIEIYLEIKDKAGDENGS